MAPEVMVEQVSAKAKLEDPESEEGDAAGLVRGGNALQEEPVVTDEAVAMAEHEGEADGVEEGCRTGEVSTMHSISTLTSLTRAAEACFEHW